MSNSDFESIPRISIDDDEIDNRRQQKVTSTPGGRQGMTSGLSRRVAYVVMAAFFAGLIACAVVIFHLSQQLQASRQELSASAARIEKLEMKLASTDTTITKSEVLLAAKLKSMDDMIASNRTEVKKLWGAQERNSRAIDASAALLKQHASSLQDIKPRLDGSLEEISRISSRLENVDGLIRESGQRMEILQENAADISAKQKQWIDKSSSMEGDFSARLNVLEDTVKSTDVFRRNTLDELRKIREELTRKSTHLESPQ